jgi:hypothetical protein
MAGSANLNAHEPDRCRAILSIPLSTVDKSSEKMGQYGLNRRRLARRGGLLPSSSGRLRAATSSTRPLSCIFVGILLEERDPVTIFGDDYRHYKERGSMLARWRK